MNSTVKWTPSLKKLAKELKNDPLNEVGETRLFSRDDGHVLVLASFGPNAAKAESFRRGESDSTLFSGFHVGTIEWVADVADEYRVRLVSGGTVAFDGTLTLSEINENTLNWYGEHPAFDGAI